MQALVAIFYADDGLVASPYIAHLKGAFEVLMSLFDRVSLRTNTGKDGEHGFPDMSQPPHMVNRGLHLASDGTWILL